MTTGFKVSKGVTEKSAVFDSGYADKTEADKRAKTLRASLRGSKIQVWVSSLEESYTINNTKQS